MRTLDELRGSLASLRRAAKRSSGGDLHVLGRRLQRRALGGILRHQLFALLVPVDLALFRHVSFALNS